MHRVVSPVEVAAALAVQRGAHDVAGGVTSGSRQLGRILVERELLTESGLQRALLAQKRLGGNLGDILIERGYVSRQQIRGGARRPGRPATRRPDPDPAGRRGARGALRGARTAPSRSRCTSLDSFLDATDFAFDLIEQEDPLAVEIVRVREDDRESVWSYSREASERYRDANRGSRLTTRARASRAAAKPPPHRRRRAPPASRRSRGTCRRSGGARRGRRPRRAVTRTPRLRLGGRRRQLSGQGRWRGGQRLVRGEQRRHARVVGSARSTGEVVPDEPVHRRACEERPVCELLVRAVPQRASAIG